MNVGEVFSLCLIDRIIDKINIKDIEKSLTEIDLFIREIEQSQTLYRVHLNHPVLDFFTIVEIKFFKFNKKTSCSVCFIAENASSIEKMERDMYSKFLGLLLSLYSDLLLKLDKLTTYNIDLKLKEGMSATISGSSVYAGYSKEHNGCLIFRINDYKHNQVL